MRFPANRSAVSRMVPTAFVPGNEIQPLAKNTANMHQTSEDRRNRILLSALELFCERGFHGTAVPLIAKRADVSVGLIYRHWASKEELVNHLYRYWKEQFFYFVEPKVRAEQGFRAQFHRFWMTCYQFAKSYPLAFSFLEIHHHHEYLDAQSRQMIENGRGSVLAFLQMGLDEKQLKPLKVDLILALVWGALVQIVRLEELGILTMGQQSLEQAEDCCWQSIRL
jgi:TetR/AcrR family transcriptional regulator, repressor of fatR-cypB operon